MMIKQFWQQFITQYPIYQNNTYFSFAFCGEGHPMADELSQLVKTGIKTATSSLAILYEKEQQTLPQVGDISIILDSLNQPVCIVKNKQVSLIPYKDMNASHALKEGEGDKSYHYWKTMHDEFFSQELATYHLSLSDDLLICFEEFEVIYQ